MTVEEYLNKSISKVDGKTIIITGANSGIGFHTAEIIAKKGGHVVLACRSKEKAIEAIDRIKAVVKDANLEYVIFDQASFNSIDSFVDNITTNYANFYALMLNAGILRPEKETFTKEGFPLTVGTNFYGLHHLMERLYPLIQNTMYEKRIIIEGSLVTRAAKYHGKKYDLIKTHSSTFHAYNISKIGVENLFAKYAQINKNPNLKFMLAEPGVCKTNIIHSFPSWIIKPANGFLKSFMHSPEKGSLPSVHLITEPHSNGDILLPRGMFSIGGFPKKRRRMSKRTTRFASIINDAELIIKTNLDKKSA
ncbi:MAG: SDR family NAD(P)-dependent oxidoreductase [Erysipelotrichaceae bacterium]|nr:SDR family NAD(P)-dependent oxidoreductase [Erysipelotrichaceae bacterium]